MLYLLLQFVVERAVAALAGMALIAVLRIASIHWTLTVPVYRLRREEEGR